MQPSISQIELAAYNRWIHRGAVHGWHECDWIEAEHALLFELNYDVVFDSRHDAAARRPESAARFTRSQPRRICRFCEQAEPRTSFSAPTPALPQLTGLPTLFTPSLCDECASEFSGTIDTELSQFLVTLLAGSAQGRMTLGAYKSLVKSALCVLPEAWIDICQEALEWVARGSDDFEPDLLRVPHPQLHTLVHEQTPWLAIAVKSEAEAPMPAIVAFLGAPRFTLAFAVPLCTLDDDLDGAFLSMPDVPIVDGLRRWPGPLHSRALPVSRGTRNRRLALVEA